MAKDKSKSYEEQIDSLEAEIKMLNGQVDSIAQHIDLYVKRIKQLEDERARIYAAGISAKVAEISAGAIGKTLPTIGSLAKKIGDIAGR